jgi:hypothetical protein
MLDLLNDHFHNANVVDPALPIVGLHLVYVHEIGPYLGVLNTVAYKLFGFEALHADLYNTLALNPGQFEPFDTCYHEDPHICLEVLSGVWNKTQLQKPER